MSSRFFDVEPKAGTSSESVQAQRIALVVGNGAYTGGYSLLCAAGSCWLFTAELPINRMAAVATNRMSSPTK